MASCCKQVRDFVDFGKHLHAEVRKLYEKLGEKAELERVKMLLDYLGRHEQHMEQTLARYEAGAHGIILDGWLEYAPNLDVDAVMQACQLPEEPGTDGIFQAAMTFDDALVNLYREIAAKAVNQNTQALFQDLLHLEQQEKIQVARAVMSLNDM